MKILLEKDNTIDFDFNKTANVLNSICKSITIETLSPKITDKVSEDLPPENCATCN